MAEVTRIVKNRLLRKNHQEYHFCSILQECQECHDIQACSCSFSTELMLTNSEAGDKTDFYGPEYP